MKSPYASSIEILGAEVPYTVCGTTQHKILNVDRWYALIINHASETLVQFCLSSFITMWKFLLS